MANYLDKGGRNNRIGAIFSVDRALNRPNNNFNTSLPNIEPYTDEVNNQLENFIRLPQIKSNIQSPLNSSTPFNEQVKEFIKNKKMINAKIKHKIESGETKVQISSKDKFNNSFESIKSPINIRNCKVKIKPKMQNSAVRDKNNKIKKSIENSQDSGQTNENNTSVCNDDTQYISK